MAKLKKTLPKEFTEFCYGREYPWTAESIEKGKELLAPCDPNARERGGYQESALHKYVPVEIVRWLIERGADVNVANSYGTPLFKHAGVGHYDVCELLLAHDAEVDALDYAEKTALYGAADGGHCDIIRLLLEHGADPCHHSRNFDGGDTPLLYMLKRMSSRSLKGKAEAAELLVKAQRERGGISDEEWQKAQDYVAGAGHEFELYKSGWGEAGRTEAEEVMERLYALFGVTPPEPVRKHDGKSPITVDEALSVFEQHQALWEFLVPPSGKCDTVQGEVIRITGRVGNESNGNGGINWDGEYRKMLEALMEFLSWGNGLEEDALKTVQAAAEGINRCKACGCPEEIDTLEKLAVKWVQRNPEPILLGKVDYRR